jgi:hypothetical protein
VYHSWRGVALHATLQQFGSVRYVTKRSTPQWQASRITIITIIIIIITIIVVVAVSPDDAVALIRTIVVQYHTITLVLRTAIEMDANLWIFCFCFVFCFLFFVFYLRRVGLREAHHRHATAFALVCLFIHLFVAPSPLYCLRSMCLGR